MKIVEKLQEIALEKSKKYSEDQFFVRGQWDLELLFKPNQYERIFNYKVIVVQTKSQGCCYYDSKNQVLDRDLMGKDARYISTDNKFMQIALLDSVYSVFDEKPAKEFILNGTSTQKTVCRTEIVVSEVIYQLTETIKNRKASVVNVGVVGNFLKTLSDYNLKVYATDCDPSLVGAEKHGVVIQDGIHTLEYVEKADCALISGMTLSTETLGDIMDVAKKSGTKVVMFAETGAWFAQEYCNTFGLDAVVSEPFPFYIFEGRSLIRVHRPRESKND